MKLVATGEMVGGHECVYVGPEQESEWELWLSRGYLPEEGALDELEVEDGDGEGEIVGDEDEEGQGLIVEDEDEEVEEEVLDEVEEDEDEVEIEEDEESDSSDGLDDMTKSELQAFAKSDFKIDLPVRFTHQEMVDAVRKAMSIR